jgi:hypothetical protein
LKIKKETVGNHPESVLIPDVREENAKTVGAPVNIVPF